MIHRNPRVGLRDARFAPGRSSTQLRTGMVATGFSGVIARWSIHLGCAVRGARANLGSIATEYTSFGGICIPLLTLCSVWRYGPRHPPESKFASSIHNYRLTASRAAKNSMVTTRMLPLAPVHGGLLLLQAQYKVIYNLGALGDENIHPLPPNESEVQIP